METSVFLAQLIGPVILAASLSLFINGERQRALAREFLHNAPLIYVMGIITLTAGLAIVLNHNVWTADWRVIITVFGWLAVIGGVMRIVFFKTVEKIGEGMLEKTWPMVVGGIVGLIVGAVLCFYGYVA